MIEQKVNSAKEMIEIGEELGRFIGGGVVIELIGDVGAGKTTFTKGLAKSLGITDTIQSPTFTISRVYYGEKFSLTHYDFYRLNDVGIMKMELAESLADPQNITVVEWAEGLSDVLPPDRIKLTFENNGENSRTVKIEGLK